MRGIKLVGTLIVPFIVAVVSYSCAIQPEPKNWDEITNYLPFEKVVNKGFHDSIGDQYFRFKARYMGTEPNPGQTTEGLKYALDGYINLRMCDIEKPDVCSHMIIIKADIADEVLPIKQNEIVEVIAQIGGSMLFISGAAGTQVKNSPLKFIFVKKVIRSLPSHAENKKKVSVESENTFELTKEAILTAQKQLNQLGYAAGKPDGNLGPKTINAVKRFQQKNGINPSGNLDKQTIDKLRELAK